MASGYVITNWQKFQHYKHRNPPWIKLHWDLLSSRDWVMLDDASRVLAVACMLIASRNDGMVPADPDYVQRVAYLNKPPDFAPLIKHGFVTVQADASALQADASTLQADCPSELELEEEIESEADGECAHDEPPTEQHHAARPPMSLPDQFRAKLKAAFPRTARVAVDEYVDWMQRRVMPETIETLYATLEDLSVTGGADAFTPSIGALESAYRQRGGKLRERKGTSAPAKPKLSATCVDCGKPRAFVCDTCRVAICKACGDANDGKCGNCKGDV